METAPGAAGGVNISFEQYSRSGNRDSGGGAGGGNIPFEHYSRSGNRDSGGGGKPWKLAQEPPEAEIYNLSNILIVGRGILEGVGKHRKLPQTPEA